MAERRLAEVAARAGVSEATVSRVLNDKPGVSDATRETVLTALDVLGYERPTKLRGERARLVGLVLPELQNPIFPALADVIGVNLAQHGLTAVLCTQTDGGVAESEYVDMLLDQQQVAGIIFAGGAYSMAAADHRHYQRLLRRRLPVVLLNAAVEGLPFARVVCDDTSAMDQALDHIIALGHRRIGLILGPKGHMPSQQKLTAARAVLEQAGLELDDELVARCQFTFQSAQAGADRVLRHGATALVCASDPMALGTIRAARRAHLRVPEDVSVVGYDDSALMAIVDPPLTTVRQPIELMGRAAVVALVEQIRGHEPVTPELLFEPELVVRRSTRPCKPGPGPASRESELRTV